MLSHLRIAHFAIIDALEAHFDVGFNVVTGETGAGKSILIDALHLILGGRAQTDLVRTGHDECSVEGLFEPLDVARVNERLDAAGLPACSDGQLVIRRTVHREGRSKAWVNGALATVGQLGQVVRGLVDISGQHEHTSLMDPQGHLALLDLFAGLGPKVAQYQAAYEELAQAARALKSLQLNEADRARKIDYLQFQLDEIEKLDPQPGEEEKLKEERQKLGGAEKLRSATQDAEGLLYSRDGAAVELVSEAAEKVEKAAAFDPELKEIAKALKEAQNSLSDVARDLGRYARGIDDDPQQLEEIDERLEAIKRLARKHGGTLEKVLERRDQMRSELSLLTQHEANLEKAQALRAQKLAQARKLADVLTKERTEAARHFADAVVQRLGDLEMKKTVFVVQVKAAGAEMDGAIEAEEGEQKDARLTPRGQDWVEFLISPNPGEEPRALVRIASGGELSRVMLAIKRVLAERDPVETYVFDEVDAGIGGATGEVVGRMIREVARERQVLCITHLAQIAAYGESHFTVSKGVKDGRTHSSLTRLGEGEGRQREVARMLSGNLTPASLAHAEELISKGVQLAAERPRAAAPRKSRKAS